VKATHNARCITCQGNIQKGEEVAVVGGWWRHVTCPLGVTRQCPVDPACEPITGRDAFIRHIYENHTEGSADARQMAVQKILSEGPGVREQMIVPKVTANALTHAVWALAHSNDRAKAQELVGSMGPSERQAYLALLTELINMMWSET
jgi:hypothetical protein